MTDAIAERLVKYIRLEKSERLSELVEYRDGATGGHIERTSR